MSTALRPVLNGEVDVQSFISWFCFKISKENTPSALLDHEDVRACFVPLFLGYLREQSATALGILNSGLTPRKSTTWSQLSTTHARVRERASGTVPASHTRLQFHHEAGHPDSPHRHSRVISPIGKVAETLAVLEISAEGEQPKNSFPRPGQRSKQKMSLGQFIGERGVGTNKRDGPPVPSRRSPGVGSKSGANRLSPVNVNGKIDLDDMVAFPAVASSVFSGPSPSVGLNRKSDATPNHSFGKRNQQVRRITPTPVYNRVMMLPGSAQMVQLQDSPGQTNCSAFADATPESPSGTLQEERMLLRQERAKRQPLIAVPSGNLISTPLERREPPGFLCHPSFGRCSPELAEAFPADVTFEHQLFCLAEIYSACMDENLSQCLSVEFHFIFQLLVTREQMPDICFKPETEGQYLSSVANCVFFAVNVLWLQRRLISFLNVATLKALRDNQRVKQFCPKLFHFLSDECLGAKAVVPMSLPESSLPLTTVAFQTDTDNRNNFVTEKEFHIFRKKRDVFYEIFRDWQDHHMLPDWSMAAKLGERIRHLVSLDCDAFLHSHLARLFQAQLVVTCRGRCLSKSPEDDPELLETLKESNPEKYQRLQERLVIPNQSSGPCPLPSFPGHQEFFKSFIDFAASPSFSQHLTDVLCSRISELTTLQVDLRESENDLAPETDARSGEQFRSCLGTLRLLAKFLGLVVFRPYRAAESIPECVLASQIAVRSASVPPVDLLSFLLDAIRQRRTILVVPWVVEFLSMMDPVSVHLTCYRALLNLLHDLFVNLKASAAPSLNSLLLRLLLGWLFEVINYPTPKMGERFASSPLADDSDSKKLQALDSLAIVDLEMLYSCCPYLGELQGLLSKFADGISSRANGLRRKITPIWTVSRSTMSTTAQQLQVQMEEAFFQNQADSLKKTVEFVAERLTSTTIKHVRYRLMPEARLWGSGEVGVLREALAEIDEEAEPDRYLQAKIATYKKVCEVAGAVADRLKSSSAEYCKCVSAEAADKAILLLLPSETSSGVLRMCGKLVQRSCIAKVSQWLSTQVDADSFRNDLVREMKKLLKIKNHGRPEDDSAGSDQHFFCLAPSHDSEAPPPADVLYCAKAFLKNLYDDDRARLVSSDDVTAVLRLISNTLLKRKDINIHSYKIMIRLTSEIVIALIVKRPDLCNQDTFSEFLILWKVHVAPWSEILPAIYCPRSFKYMSVAADNLELSWTKLEMLTLKVLQSNLVPATSVDELCLKLLKLNWKEDFQFGLLCYCRNVILQHCPSISSVEKEILPLVSAYLSATFTEFAW